MPLQPVLRLREDTTTVLVPPSRDGRARVFAPRFALGALALEGDDDPHLAPGVHLRLLPTPLVGLPTRPVGVYRIDLGEAAAEVTTLDQAAPAVWVDNEGRPLSPPFDVPEDGAWGLIPAGTWDPCVWVKVLGSGSLQVSIRGPVGGRLETLFTRSAEPWELCASHIERVFVSGDGEVEGLLWLSAKMTVHESRLHSLLALPVRSGRRYEALTEHGSADRVGYGAPRALGLEDQPEAGNPAACTPIGSPASAEIQRLAGVIGSVHGNLVAPGGNTLDGTLQALLDDSVKPHLQTLSHGLHGTGNAAGSLRGRRLEQLLLAARDPGVARWLGLAGLDTGLGSNQQGHLIAYLFRARFLYDFDLWTAYSRDFAALTPGLRSPASMAADEDPQLPFPDAFDTTGDLVSGQSVAVELWAVACVVAGAPPDPPPAPEIVSVSADGPLLPPEAVRIADVGLAGLLPGAGLAAALLGPHGPVSLNPARVTGRRKLIFPPAGQDPKVSLALPRENGILKLAQVDIFGRASPWRSRVVDELPRPAPPAATLRGAYTPPEEPPATGDAAGALRLSIPVPPAASLCLGALPLAHVELETLEGPPAPSSVTVTGETVAVTFPGLPLAPRAEASGRYRARFTDGEGNAGAWSPAVRVTMVDRRPPPPVSLPNTLVYASRPDVTGRATVSLDWPSAQRTRWRVYFSDETRLGAFAGRSFQNQARAIALPQDRAAHFVNKADIFGREAFELLTPTPLGRSSFTHRVDAGLGVLLFYKVVPVSETRVEGSFKAATLVPRGIPNQAPPARPLLEVTGRADGQVQLAVQLVRGGTSAVRWRLRRTTVAVADPLAMLVVAEGAIEAGKRRLELVDAGGWPHATDAPLRPWMRYAWVVEVQGADLPGSTLPGAWSPPSNRVGTWFPAPPPGAPQGFTASEYRPGTVRLTWEHPPGDLRGGSVGGYRYLLRVAEPGAEERPLAEVRASDKNLWTTTAPSAPTRYRIALVDPLERMSPWRSAVFPPPGDAGGR